MLSIAGCGRHHNTCSSWCSWSTLDRCRFFCSCQRNVTNRGVPELTRCKEHRPLNLFEIPIPFLRTPYPFERPQGRGLRAKENSTPRGIGTVSSVTCMLVGGAPHHNLQLHGHCMPFFAPSKQHHVFENKRKTNITRHRDGRWDLRRPR
jgi:hypothetical protein